MKDELVVTFDSYIELFQKDEHVNVQIKKFILNNIGYGKVVGDFVDRFLEVSIQKGYTYSIALGYAMRFWVLHGYDIDLAITYNEKAREIFMSLDDYQNQEGILTVANNAVLAYILKGDYGLAYQELLQAMPWAEKEDRITYYSAFLNNGAAILSEFGLYGKAIQQVEETLLKREIIGDSNYFVTVYLLSNLYLHNHDCKKARKLITTHLDELSNFQFYTYEIFSKQLLECAILDDKKKEADELYQAVVANYDFAVHDVEDNCELYMTLAHYYMYIHDYDKAEDCYLELYEHIEQILGNKRQILSELAILYECKNDYDKAYAFQKQAYQKSVQYSHFVDDMYRKETEDVWEKNRMLSYEVLYKRLLKITEAGRHITATLTWEQLFHTMQRYLPDILHYQHIRLFQIDHQETIFSIHGNKLEQMVEHDKTELLTACIERKEPLYMSDVTSKFMKDYFLNHDISSILLLPVILNDEVAAICYFDSEHPENFVKSDQQILHVLSDYLSIAITNIKQYMKALEKSTYDYLTSTYNRGGLVEEGKRMLVNCLKEKKSIGALMIDIDNFKIINDTYGHMFGDEVIKAVTEIMHIFKQHGIIARFGGEEFTLLIDGLSIDELYHVAETIRHACEDKLVKYESVMTHFTISIGCAYQPVCDITLSKLLDEADQKLYVAKRNGKNYVQM